MRPPFDVAFSVVKVVSLKISFPTAANPKVCPRLFLHKLILKEAQAHRKSGELAWLMQATNSILRFLLTVFQQVFVNADMTAVINDITGLVIVTLSLVRINNLAWT